MDPDNENPAMRMQKVAARIKRREAENYAKLAANNHDRDYLNALNHAIQATEAAVKSLPPPTKLAPKLVVSSDELKLQKVAKRCARNQQLEQEGRGDGGATAVVNDEDEDDELERHARPLKAIQSKPWTQKACDATLIKDPYLRKQGLHRNNAPLLSPNMLTKLRTQKFAEPPTVDFNFMGYSDAR